PAGPPCPSPGPAAPPARTPRAPRSAPRARSRATSSNPDGSGRSRSRLVEQTVLGGLGGLLVLGDEGVGQDLVDLAGQVEGHLGTDRLGDVLEVGAGAVGEGD